MQISYRVAADNMGELHIHQRTIFNIILWSQLLDIIRRGIQRARVQGISPDTSSSDVEYVEKKLCY